MPDHQPSALTEHELYARLTHNLRQCEDDATQLAYARMDKRWAIIAALFHGMIDKCAKLVVRRLN